MSSKTEESEVIHEYDWSDELRDGLLGTRVEGVETSGGKMICQYYNAHLNIDH